MEKLLSRKITDIFWKRYCYLEQETENRSKKGWFEMIVFEIFNLVELEESAKGEEHFWDYYLNRSFNVNIVLLVLHMCFHIALVLIIMGFPLKLIGFPLDPLFYSFNSLFLNVLPWSLFSFVILYFLLARKYAVHWITAFGLNHLDLWMGIGNSLFCSRLIVLGMQIYRFGFTTDCPAAADFNNLEDKSFLFFALKIVVDSTAVGVFSVFPFPYRINVYICILEWISQMQLLRSCGGRLTDDGSQAMHFFLLYIYATVTFLYVIFSTHSLVLEFSARRSYQNNRRQKIAVEEKRRIVNFLCFDTNHLLASVQKTTRVMLKLVEGGIEGERLQEGVDQQVQVVTSAVNELLLMVRVEEKMFVFQLKDRVVLSKIVSKVKQNILVNAENYEFQGIPETINNAEVRTDSFIFEVLYGRLWSFALRLAGDRGPEDPRVESIELLVMVEREAVHRSKLHGYLRTSSHFISCSLVFTPNTLNKKLCYELELEKDTCILICLRVAASCGGCFWISSDSIHFLLPCELLVDYGVINPSSSGHSSSSVEQLADMSERAASNKSLDWSSLRPLAFVSTVSSEETHGVLDKISTSLDSPILIQEGGPALFSKQQLESHQLLLVDSLHDCRELKGLGFTGLIVLISSFHSLLRDAAEPAFDYSLPIPCLDEDMDRFTTWLLDLQQPTVGTNSEIIYQSDERSVGTESTLSVYAYILWLNDIFVYLSRPLLRMVKYRWWESLFLFGMISLPREQRESYIRWRAFTPTNKWVHHTKFIDLFILCSNARSFFVGLLLDDNFVSSGRAITMIVLSVVLIRQPVFDVFFRTFQIPLTLISRVGVVFYLFVTRISRFLQLFSHGVSLYNIFTGNLDLSSPFKRNMPWEQLMTERFGSLSFLQTLYFFVERFGIGRHMFFPLLWPAVPFMAVVSAAMVIVCVWALPRNIVSHQVLLCTVVFQAFFLVIELLIIYNFEYFFRKEFTALCDYILSDDLMQRSISLCQPVIRRSLAKLNLTNHSLLGILHQKILKKKIKACNSILPTIRTALLSGLLTHELVNELEFSRLTLENQAYQPQKAVHLLRSIVEGVISSFNQELHPDLQVVMHACLDGRLSVIRFDKKQFVTLLTSCLVLARKRLMKALSLPKGKERPRQQDILIDIRMVEVERVYRFTDIRKMIVIVADGGEKVLPQEEENVTSKASERDGASVKSACIIEELALDGLTSSFSQSVCEKFVESLDVDSLYETGQMEHVKYSNYSRFTYPYQITMDSQMAAKSVKDSEGLLFLSQESVSSEEIVSCINRFEELGATLKLDRSAKVWKPLTFMQWIELKESGVFCKMVFFTFLDDNRCLDAVLDRLQQCGWKIELEDINLLEEYDFKGLIETDCVLLDRSMDRKTEVSLRNFIIRLRVHGYRKLLVDLALKETVEGPVADNGEGFVKRKGVWDGVDLTLFVPLSARAAAELFLSCEFRNCSLLLNYDEEEE